MNKYIVALFICLSLYDHCTPCEPPTKKQAYDKEKTEDLRQALSLSSLADIPRLIDANADPVVQTILRETVLHEAAFGNSIGLCKLALKHNISPNVQNYEGLTPAMKTTSVSVLRLLIENGANIHQKSRYGRTTLHHHAFTPLVTTGDTISLLCDEGIDPNAQDDQGATALHCMCDCCSLDSEKLAALCIQGADTTLKNKYGRTLREELQGRVRWSMIRSNTIGVFDEIVAAATTVRTSQQEARRQLIAAHLVPPLPKLVNEYIGGLPWNEQCKSEMNKILGQQVFSVKKIVDYPDY